MNKSDTRVLARLASAAQVEHALGVAVQIVGLASSVSPRSSSPSKACRVRSSDSWCRTTLFVVLCRCLHEPTSSSGRRSWCTRRCRCRHSVLTGDGHHLLGPRVADMPADDHEFGEVQRDLVDVRDGPARLRTAASVRCGRPACRTARPTRRIRRTADSSAGRSGGRPHSHGTTRSPTKPSSRTRRRSSRTAAIGLVEVDGRQPGEPVGMLPEPSRRPRHWRPGRARSGRARRLSRPKSTPAPSIDGRVASIGRSTSFSGIAPPVHRRSEASMSCRETEGSGAASRRRSSYEPT